MKSHDDIFFQYKAILSTLEIFLFSAAIFIN